MTKAWVKTSGTSTTKGASVLFFGFHWSFAILGAIWERLAVAGNAGLVRLDHGRIGDDYLEYFVGPGGRDDRPVLISPEVGDRNSAGRFQRVLIVVMALREKGRGGEEGCCNDGEAGASF